MTLQEKIYEYATDNAMTGRESVWQGVTDGEGIPEEALQGRYLFTHEGKSYYLMHIKMQKFFRENKNESKISN